MDEDEPRDVGGQPDASNLLMVLLRYDCGWDQAELAAASGVAPAQISIYDLAKRAVPPRAMEKFAEATDFPNELLGPAERVLRSFQAARRGRRRPGRAAVDAAWAELLALLGQVADLVLSPLEPLVRSPQRPTPADRAEGAELARRLARSGPAERELLLEEGEEYWGWAVAEQLAAESLVLAPNEPRKALELAQLALRIAERVPVEEAFRWRLTGHVLACLTNARRACGQLPAARRDFARAARLWQDGAPGDPGLLLNPAVLPWIEAGLRKGERRLAEARERIEEALRLDRGELRGKILLTKSNILAALDDPEGSTAVLQEAAHLIDADREPRLALVVGFNLLADLCHRNRAAEAAPRLPAVRELAERLGKQPDLNRVDWLEGKVRAGLGQAAEAQVAFERVQRRFREEGLAYEHALVSLDLALVHLAAGRTAEVRRLAREMLWIFRAQGIHREALAALKLFCDAAQREAATLELARQVSHYLEQAQHDPDLHFELG